MGFYQKNKDPSFWDVQHYSCNCGSFALNLTNWFYPYEEEDDSNRIEEVIFLVNNNTPKEEILDLFLDLDTNYLLDNFKNDLVLIKEEDIQNLPAATEIIAFRIAIHYPEDCAPNSLSSDDVDMDFHFKVRRNGKWQEKIGGCEIRECKLQEDKMWSLRYNRNYYNSKIKYFIKKES